MRRAARALAAIGVALAGLAACSPPPVQDPGEASGPPSTVPRPTLEDRRSGGGDLLFYVDRAGIHRWDSESRQESLLEDTRDAGEVAPAPGGGRVAYVRSTGAAGGFVDELWVAHEDRRDRPRRLVDPAAVTAAVGAAAATPPPVKRPRWSPDGARIAFLVDAAGGRMLVVCDADTGAVDASFAPRKAAQFVWSPDGGSIAYTSGDSAAGPADVMVAGVSTGTTQLWAQAVAATSIAWGVDGAGLVLTSPVGATGTGAVLALDAAGAPPRSLLLAPGPASYGDAAVLSDGTVTFTLGEVAQHRPRLLQTVPPTTGSSEARTIADDVGGERAGPRWSAHDLVALGVAGSRGVLEVADSSGRSRTTVATDVSAFAWAAPPPPGGGGGPTGV